MLVTTDTELTVLGAGTAATGTEVVTVDIETTTELAATGAMLTLGATATIEDAGATLVAAA